MPFRTTVCISGFNFLELEEDLELELFELRLLAYRKILDGHARSCVALIEPKLDRGIECLIHKLA